MPLTTSFLLLAAIQPSLLWLAALAIVVAILAILNWKRMRRDAQADQRPNPPPKKSLQQPPPKRPIPPATDTAAVAPAPTATAKKPAALAAAKSWAYQLQNLDIGHAAASPFDVLVIDYALDGDDDSALSAKQVAQLRRKPDGGRRMLLAYFSVGEAESYRSYWQRGWKKSPPSWLIGENPEWEENYAVRFWDAGWQSLMFGGPDAYLDKIIAQGFDGVYLDKCDVFEDMERSYPMDFKSRKDPEGDMVDFIAALSLHAKSRNPGFAVVMQNAEGLWKHARIIAAVDGAAKEELLFGQDGGERRNQDDDYQYSRHHLDLARAAGKPVFVVEYLANRQKMAEAQAICDKLGYVLHISGKNRELDRLDYDAPVA